MDKRNTVLLEYLKDKKDLHRYALEFLKFILVTPSYSRTTELTSSTNDLTTLRRPLHKPPVSILASVDGALSPTFRKQTNKQTNKQPYILITVCHSVASRVRLTYFKDNASCSCEILDRFTPD